MILRGTVFSNVLGMDTGVTILIPDEKRGEQYKVVYLLHGLCGNAGSWIDYTMLPSYAAQYRMVFVMPEAGRSFYCNMKYGFPYFTYLTEELPKLCQNAFQISSKREDTILIGGSMGGYGALKFALSKPETYGICCALSSACLFLPEDLQRLRDAIAYNDFSTLREQYGEPLTADFTAIFGESLQCLPEDEISVLAEKISLRTDKPKLYLSCGTEDPLMRQNMRMTEILDAFGFDLTFESHSGNHNWEYFNMALKHALDWVQNQRQR